MRYSVLVESDMFFFDLTITRGLLKLQSTLQPQVISIRPLPASGDWWVALPAGPRATDRPVRVPPIAHAPPRHLAAGMI